MGSASRGRTAARAERGGAALFEYTASRTGNGAVGAGWGAVLGRAAAAAAKLALGAVIAVLGLFAALRGGGS